MAITVHQDIVGTSARQTAEGWEYNRLAEVEGLTGSPTAQLVAAANASGLPALGATLPGLAGTTLTEKNPVSRGNGVVQVRQTYRFTGTPDDPADEGSVSVSTGIITIQTNKDVLGELVVVNDGDVPGRDQSPTLNVEQPVSRVSISRTESSSPGAKSQEFVGTVNTENGFSVVGSAAARTWRCDGIDGSSSDGGKTWQVTYQFIHRRDTWDQEVHYTDPQTGSIPQEVIESPGRQLFAIKLIQVYAEKNFNNLNLT